MFALQFLTSTAFGHLFGIYQHGCDELGIKPYDYLQILDKLLILEPDNLFAQEQKYERLYNSITLSIHEAPSGVLFGANSASINDTYVLLKELNEFEQYTKSINKIKPPIIDEARFYSKLNSKCTILGFPLKVSLSNHNGKPFHSSTSSERTVLVVFEVKSLYYLAWIDYLQSTENLNFLEHLQKHHDYHMDE